MVKEASVNASKLRELRSSGIKVSPLAALLILPLNTLIKLLNIFLL